MIESQSDAQIPFAETNSVLHIGRWLIVPTPVGKLKLLLRARIELLGIGAGLFVDQILQVFIHGTKNSIHPELPLVPAVMARKVRAHISLSISAILGDDDRGGLRIGIQNRGRITDASCNAQEDVGRKCMRVVDLAGCFLSSE